VEEEAAEIYEEYVRALAPGTKPKPAVGFIAGTSTTRGLTYGHAGAVWWDENETAQAKKDRWRRAGIDVAATIADVGPLLERRVKEAGLTLSPR
jgi:succinyl-CoA synthetase alpha subunit